MADLTEADLNYLRNINTRPGPGVGQSIDPTQPGPTANRIAGDLLNDAQPAAREISPTHVICPNCCHDFRAISQADRAALAQSGAQPRRPEIDAAQRRTYMQSDAGPIWLWRCQGETNWHECNEAEYHAFSGNLSNVERRLLYTTPSALPEGAREALEIALDRTLTDGVIHGALDQETADALRSLLKPRLEAALNQGELET